MGRAPCCEKVGLKKGPWTQEEDEILVSYIQENGHCSWRDLPKHAGLLRCGKSCRLRWINYLRPDIKRGSFSVEEEQTIIQLHALLGNRWSTIATHLPKRTDNEIKNYWNSHLKKRLSEMGIDPVTHKPKSDSLNALHGQRAETSSALSHMAQWETARMQAEVRLASQSRVRSKSLYSNHIGLSYQSNHAPNKDIISMHVTDRSRCLDVLNAVQRRRTANNKNSKFSPSRKSSLTFLEGGSTDANYTYFSLFHKASQNRQFQFPPPSRKPLPGKLDSFLLGAGDTNGEGGHQTSNAEESQNPLFPNLTDMMLFTNEPHCSSRCSVSSADEQSTLPAEVTEIGSHEDTTTTTFKGCFNADLLLDLAGSPSCELEEERSIKDYWSTILDMLSSPGDSSTVHTIF